MIGYISGKFLAAEDGNIIIDVNGVGYSVLVSSKFAVGLVPGASVELYVHTNVRENAIELFGFSNLWEKKVFQALVSVSGVGPRTAITLLGGLEGETVLSAIVREDRATLSSVSGVGKKTTELLIVQLADKARKLLAERPHRTGIASVPASAVAAQLQAESPGSMVSGGKRKRGTSAVPAQGTSVNPGLGAVDIADLWNEALAALVNLGYREGDAILAIKQASSKTADAGGPVSLEKLIMSSLQLMSRGL